MTTLAQNQTFEQTALITVPFYGSNIFVVEHNNEPFVSMKSIVENMGLDWASQYTKLKSNTKRWGIAIITIPNVSNLQQAICLPLRKLCGWMTSISPNKVKLEIRDTVIKYQEECDDVLYAYWTKGVAINPRTTTNDLITQTLSQISNGNKKLYMSMYNGLIHRFKVGRLSDIPVIDINKAISTAYAIAIEWNRKNQHGHDTLKLNDGEHYFVVKDGVVLWEKVLKSHCDDIPANTLKNPTLMLEHIRQVVGEFVGKDALPAPKPTLDINYPAVTARPPKSFNANQHWFKADDFVDGHFDPVRDFLIGLETAGYEVTGLQIINQAKTWVIQQQVKAIKQIDKGYKCIADGLKLNSDYGMNVSGFVASKVSM